MRAQRALERGPIEVLVLSMIAGGFITLGALFSTLIATGTTNEGVQRLLEGFGFSVGFFAVVLTRTLLFTEANVEMPATFLSGDHRLIAGRVARLWNLAAVGNFAGAFLIGVTITTSQDYSPAVNELLGEIVDAKMRYREIGGAEGWFKAASSTARPTWPTSPSPNPTGSAPAGDLPSPGASHQPQSATSPGAFLLVALPFWALDKNVSTGWPDHLKGGRGEGPG